MDLKILGMVFSIIISIGVPVSALIYFIKKGYGVKFYFIGGLVFFVSQIILRLPLLNFLEANVSSYSIFKLTNPILYIIFICITAGLFEEVGRYIGGKGFKKEEINFKNAVAFGFGHGGIEAILFVGISAISNLAAYINAISSVGQGAFEIKQMFLGLTGLELAMAGVERIWAMSFHIAMTVLVLYGVKIGRKKLVFLAILIHGAFNFIGVMSSQITGSIIIAQGFMGIMAIVAIVFVYRFKNKFNILGGVLNEKSI